MRLFLILLLATLLVRPSIGVAANSNPKYWGSAGGWDIYKISEKTRSSCYAERTQRTGEVFFLHFFPAQPYWTFMFQNDRWPPSGADDVEFLVTFGDNPGIRYTASPIAGVFYNVWADLTQVVPYLESFGTIHISKGSEWVSFKTDGLEAASKQIKKCASTL